MNLVQLLINPTNALVVFCVILCIALIMLDDEGAFSKKFTHFGPGTDVTFLHIKLDTWSKVYIVYAISFVVAFLQTYYHEFIQEEFIDSRFINPAVTEKLPATATATKVILASNPIITWILDIITVFITMTMQLQFVLPQLIATMCVLYPYYVEKFNENKFLS